MIYTGSGDLPRHLYVYVDSSFVRRDGKGFEPCVWFGLTSQHGRMWGCNILLECGAMYRNVPPHAMAFCADPKPKWTEQDAQVWDCYGAQFTTLEYKYLSEVECLTRKSDRGTYLFTAAPIGDGFSRHPEQAKEFTFIELDNGRLTVLPTDHLLVDDRSFVKLEMPRDIRRQSEVYSCEGPTPLPQEHTAPTSLPAEQLEGAHAPPSPMTPKGPTP